MVQKSTALGLVLVFAVLTFSGCGASGPTLYPVEGKVSFNQEVPEGASVVFVPMTPVEGQDYKPSGQVKADGSFTLSTHPFGEGAPAGEYQVLISWYGEDARGLGQAKNKLPSQYSDPEQKIFKATVKNEKTVLEPFVLSKK